MEFSKNELLGALKDMGHSPTAVNRIGRLLEVFGDNVPQFAGATSAQLLAAYRKAGGNSSFDLGKASYAAFDDFVALYKRRILDVKQVAQETVKAMEVKATEKLALKSELMSKEIDFDTLTTALAALGTLKIQKCVLGKILDMYDMAKGAAK